MLRFTRWITTAALVVAGLQLPCASAQDLTLLVFAAASMKNALDDVDAAFTKESGGKVVASYEASSALMKQIEAGAPADVFVSADLKWMDYGSQKKLINDDTRINFYRSQGLQNRQRDDRTGLRSRQTRWRRHGLPEHQRRRLIGAQANVKRWRASLDRGNYRCPADLRRDAMRAWRRFVSCVQALSHDEAMSLWRAVSDAAREGTSTATGSQP